MSGLEVRPGPLPGVYLAGHLSRSVPSVQPATQVVVPSGLACNGRHAPLPSTLTTQPAVHMQFLPWLRLGLPRSPLQEPAGAATRPRDRPARAAADQLDIAGRDLSRGGDRGAIGGDRDRGFP